MINNQMDEFIKDLISKNHELFTEEDFSECRKVVTDFAEIIDNLEQTQTKFRRKLSEVAAGSPHDKDKVIYLQGMVDGMNLVITPLKKHRDH
jgi:hypothetical protein